MNADQLIVAGATAVSSLPQPQPRGGPIAIDVATMDDLPFLDAMQKRFGRALGYFPTKQFQGYIETGGVLVARPLPIADCQLPNELNSNRKSQIANRQSLGYVISRDRYLKRDELGVIFQLCVAPGHQRGLIGATLVREVFARSAYGCRLCCCWCAQDLEANSFWESLGFVPLAFRVGSGRKKRLHIFWQRRIDDVQSQLGNRQSAIPYWYPFQTSSGALRADRLVFPIPPGVRWQDVQPIEVPTVARAECSPQVRPCLEGPKKDMGETPMLREKKPRPQPSANTVAIIVGGRVKYVPKPGAKPEPAKIVKPKRARPACPERSRRAKASELLTFDPRFLQQNRELRDRYLERVNAEPHALGSSCGKYDVSRALPPARSTAAPSHALPRGPLRQLPAA